MTTTTDRTRVYAIGVIVAIVLGLSLVNRVVFDRSWAGTLGSAAGVLTGIVVGGVAYVRLAQRRTGRPPGPPT